MPDLEPLPRLEYPYTTYALSFKVSEPKNKLSYNERELARIKKLVEKRNAKG
jgi:hypothetical protein